MTWTRPVLMPQLFVSHCQKVSSVGMGTSFMSRKTVLILIVIPSILGRGGSKGERD